MIIGINASNIKSYGGINHIFNLIKNLKTKEFKKNLIKKIIIWSSPAAFRELKKINNPKIIINKLKSDNVIYNFFWKIFFLNLNLKKNHCDVLLSLDGIVLRKYNRTVVFYQNLIPFNYQEIINYGFTFQTCKNLFTLFLYKISNIYADGSIVLNKYGLRLIESKLGKLNKKSIIPHGVSNFFFNLKKKNKKNKYLDLIYISSIDLYKHQWNVIEAVHRLNAEGKNIRLKLVGPISNDQSKFNLQTQIEKANKNKKTIFFYGSQSKDRIARLINKSDVFLFASSCESFGLTLLEGMASNLPILSSNKSGLDITSKKEAIYFNPLEVESIKAAIEKFLNLDKVSIRRNQVNTTKIAKTYKWSVTSEKTFDFIKKIYDLNYNNHKKKIGTTIGFGLKDFLINYYKNNINTISNFANFFTPVGLFFIFYFHDNKFLTVAYAISLAIASFYTQIFSSNMRSILIIDKTKDIRRILAFRLFLSLLMILIGSIIVKIFFDIDLDVLLLAFSIVCFTWTKEILIVNRDSKNEQSKEIIFQIIYTTVFLICYIFYIFTGKYSLFLIFSIYIFLEVIFRSYFIFKNKVFSINYLNIWQKSFKIKPILLMSFWSGICFSLLNIIIRLIVNNNYEVSIAGDYFFFLSLATFPGTVVASVLGASCLNKEKKLPTYFNFFLLIYLFIGILAFFIPLDYFSINANSAIITTSFTGIIAAYSQSIRQLNIINLTKRVFTFKRDIIHFFISLLTLLIFVVFFKDQFIYYILTISLLSLFVHLRYFNPLKDYRKYNA